MPVSQFPAILAVLWIAYLPFLIFWFYQPLNYQNPRLERVLLLGAMFLIPFAVIAVSHLQ